MNEERLSRNMDLVRAILLWAEEGAYPEDKPAVDELTLAYHCHIMLQAELIEGTATFKRRFGPGPRYDSRVGYITCLTWKGHEFPETVRSEETWARVKSIFSKHGIPFSLQILISVARGILAKKGLPLG